MCLIAPVEVFRYVQSCRAGAPQSWGHGPVQVCALLGTGTYSRRWVVGEWSKLHLCLCLCVCPTGKQLFPVCLMAPTEVTRYVQHVEDSRDTRFWACIRRKEKILKQLRLYALPQSNCRNVYKRNCYWVKMAHLLRWDLQNPLKISCDPIFKIICHTVGLWKVENLRQIWPQKFLQEIVIVIAIALVS